MPRGYRTRKGPLDRELVLLYGFAEHSAVDYPPRTRQNVRDSDGTIVFATSWVEYGIKLTLKECELARKPVLLLTVAKGPVRVYVPVPNTVQWIRSNKIGVLNVAGSADETIEAEVRYYLDIVFHDLGRDR